MLRKQQFMAERQFMTTQLSIHFIRRAGGDTPLRGFANLQIQLHIVVQFEFFAAAVIFVNIVNILVASSGQTSQN